MNHTTKHEYPRCACEDCISEAWDAAISESYSKDFPEYLYEWVKLNVREALAEDIKSPNWRKRWQSKWVKFIEEKTHATESKVKASLMQLGVIR